MSYVSLYRLYRPSNFEDLVGQEHIKRTLFNALLRKKFAHAYLFTGPRGTGKTSAAKLIAKAVNCISPLESGEPCNSCENCVAANNNTMQDILEIDAASNNGVDEIRNIRDQVHFSPAAGKYKVFIIDEVHMLSVGAFNALLKTLEEPPPHVIFILATTEPHKVLATIISRCQRLDFRRISPQAIVERMKYIVEDQKLEVEEDALHLIASIAQGGMRDALSLLDQTISYAEGKVTTEDVTSIVGKTSIRFIGNVVGLIEKGDLSNLIDQVDEIIETGKEPEYFIEDLIGYYRDLLIYQSTKNPSHLMTAVLDEHFEELASVLNAYAIQQIVSELLSCQSNLKWTKQAKTTIEVTLVKLLDLKHSTSSPGGDISQMLIEQISTLKEEMEKLKKVNPTPIKQSQSVSQPPLLNNPVQEKGETNIPDTKELILKQILPVAKKAFIEYIKPRYNVLITNICNGNEGLFNLLSESHPVVCSKTELVICLPSKSHVQLAYQQDKEIIEKNVIATMGHPINVVFTEVAEWNAIVAEYTEIVRAKKNN